MLIQLPAETWIEILNWLRRRDLIKKLEKLWDRQFTPIVQDWLHKYNKNVKLGHLRVDSDGLSARSCEYEQWEKVPFSDVDMPGNIISLERIAVSYMDSTVLTFLRRLRPLFRNSGLKIDDYIVDELPIQTALRQLMPIFSNGSIEALSLDCQLLRFFSTNYSAILSNAKLMEVWNFEMSNERQQILVDWLFTKRDDDHARILISWSWHNSDLFDKIRKRFMHATRQCACSPFFVRFWTRFDESPTPYTENIRTSEQLTYKTREHGSIGLITNCPKNTNEEWLNRKETEVLEWNLYNNEQQVITLQSLKISPLLYAEDDANQQKSCGCGKKLI